MKIEFDPYKIVHDHYKWFKTPVALGGAAIGVRYCFLNWFDHPYIATGLAGFLAAVALRIWFEELC